MSGAAAPSALNRSATRPGRGGYQTPVSTNARRVNNYQRLNAEDATANTVTGRRSGPPRAFQRTEVPGPETQHLHILCLPYTVRIFVTRPARMLLISAHSFQTRIRTRKRTTSLAPTPFLWMIGSLITARRLTSAWRSR